MKSLVFILVFVASFAEAKDCPKGTHECPVNRCCHYPFLTGSEQGPQNTLVCDARATSLLNAGEEYRFRLTSAPFEIVGFKKVAGGQIQVPAIPYVDEQHMCGEPISNEGLISKCTTTDVSTPGSLSITHSCDRTISGTTRVIFHDRVDYSLSPNGFGSLICGRNNKAHSFDLSHCTHHDF